MKKIISICFALIFVIALSVNAQQNNAAAQPSGAKVVNPNIERMRIVNEKMAAEKAAAPATIHKAAPHHQNAKEIAGIKAANRAKFQAAKPNTAK